MRIVTSSSSQTKRDKDNSSRRNQNRDKLSKTNRDRANNRDRGNNSNNSNNRDRGNNNHSNNYRDRENNKASKTNSKPRNNSVLHRSAKLRSRTKILSSTVDSNSKLQSTESSPSQREYSQVWSYHKPSSRDITESTIFIIKEASRTNSHNPLGLQCVKLPDIFSA